MRQLGQWSIRVGGIFALLLGAASSGFAQPSLFSNTKNWANLPDKDDKPTVEAKDALVENFLPAEDPPIPARIRSGWFGDFGALFAMPRFHGNRFSSDFRSLLTQQFPSMDVTTIGRSYGIDFGIGYRLESLGEVRIHYRGNYGQNQQTVPTNLPILALAPTIRILTGSLGVNLSPITGILNGLSAVSYRSRFEMNTVDPLLGTDWVEVYPKWEVKLEAGGRYGSFMLEDRGDNPFIHQMARTTYSGGGPLAALGFQHQIVTLAESVPTWFYGRVEGSYLFGSANQTLDERINGLSSILYQNSSHASTSRGTPRVGAEVGLSITDMTHLHLRVQVGYQFDRWYTVGNVDNSRLNLTLNGAFVRVEWNY